ncbi:hypothetical protein DPSP01_007425 [Paraphaeosphaeria sporulosa]
MRYAYPKTYEYTWYRRCWWLSTRPSRPTEPYADVSVTLRSDEAHFAHGSKSVSMSCGTVLRPGATTNVHSVEKRTSMPRRDSPSMTGTHPCGLYSKTALSCFISIAEPHNLHVAHRATRDDHVPRLCR